MSPNQQEVRATTKPASILRLAAPSPQLVAKDTKFPVRAETVTVKGRTEPIKVLEIMSLADD